jgi:hypothetical protein
MKRAKEGENGKGKREKMEGMNQTEKHCMHTWKCHNETPVQLLYTIKTSKN